MKKVTEELGDTGRILVRESGTEPVVRVMVEAESEEVCQKYVDMVVGVISEKGMWLNRGLSLPLMKRDSQQV